MVVAQEGYYGPAKVSLRSATLGAQWKRPRYESVGRVRNAEGASVVLKGWSVADLPSAYFRGHQWGKLIYACMVAFIGLKEG